MGRILLGKEILANRIFAITNNLTNCSTNNTAQTIEFNQRYQATITANNGYTLTSAVVSVKMSGIDITEEVYSNGVIDIPNVKGTLVIAVSAMQIIYLVSGTYINCSSDNPQTQAPALSSYQANISADEGFTLRGGTISVYMNDVDITDEAYSNGQINISSVDGNIVISIVAVEGADLDPVFNNNGWDVIDNISAIIAEQHLTAAQVEENYGWKLGDLKDVELSNGETIQLQIIGVNHDTLSSDHTSKAGLTLQMKECLNTRYAMNSTDTNVGGWRDSEMRTTTLPTIKALLPQDLQNVIKLVDKKAADGGNTNYHETLTSSDDLFLLCEKEVAETSTYAQDGANEGTQYEYWVGKSASDRIKHYGAEQAATSWWLRSSSSTSTTPFVSISAGGNVFYFGANNSRGLSLALCV
jgi:hypothetical protein